MNPRDSVLHFNGLQGTTGRYQTPSVPLTRFASAIRGRRPPRVAVAKAVEAGIDADDLGSAGWGVVFPQDCDPAIREALAPLLERRQSQAKRQDERRYRQLTYLPGDTKRSFLPRYGAGPGPVNPHRVPYYLLLVGGPRSIPFELQYELDVQYAIGRLAFDTPREYARYAASVVDYERGEHRCARRAALFGVENGGDVPTRISVENLVEPLGRELSATGWQVSSVLRADATRDRLRRMLGGGERPSLLLTAGHAVMFPSGHPRQRDEQGALVCADWPGPSWRGPLPPEHLFAAADVTDDADVQGLVSFHFACFSAGTPSRDGFDLGRPQERSDVAPDPFVARLPQRLLGHPAGGALAVIGHVDRAWEHSFLWDSAGSQVGVFASTLRKIMDGAPVGFAMEDFGQRYAELATELLELRWESSTEPDDATYVRVWTAFRDARTYAILGDPAVRLRPEEAP
ncbi:MAG: hypothetical protein V3T72_13020 [Thermoanaerobaculia bacterium]